MHGRLVHGRLVHGRLVHGMTNPQGVIGTRILIFEVKVCDGEFDSRAFFGLYVPDAPQVVFVWVGVVR